MTLADLELSGAAPREDYGRTPPQDLAAEQSVLGGMLLSKDAIADVIEVLRGNDFYRPAHETVYEAVLDLYGRGEPADAVTVAAELTKRGELGQIGGPAYLHTLLSSVPTAANAGYYARIVRERAVLRRLVTAGTRIVQLGYATDGGDVDEIVNAAQAEVYAVTERRTSEDYLPLSEIIEGTIDEIEASSHRGDGLTGIPTGFADLDRLTNGFHAGQMIVIAARPAVGKALALDTPLPTPSGWTTMGEVQVGDDVLGADGRPTRVMGATEVMRGRPCFEVHFSDGSVLVADEQHQWLTETHDAPAAVRTTGEIAATLFVGAGPRRPNYSVAPAPALVLSGTVPPPLSVSSIRRSITAVRPVASVPVRCVEVAAEDHLYLAGPSMIPTHNSTLGLDIVRSAAIHHQMSSVIFSLEMGRNEITMRLLSAEARIPLQNMRKGTMREEDWTRLARTMGEVSEAPLFIDDSPNMSLMEIRAKCRRLKQRHGLRLVVVDYLQLMSSGKRVESRQQEVSEFSRALKLLAKELEVPVIALSQLNRGPEQRTDKKPQMSDLRESGCLTADTRVLRADTGAETTLGELYAAGAKDVPVWSLDDSLRYVRRHLTHVFSTGVKPVFRMRLGSGREIRATGNHRFLTYEGWRSLDSLKAGDRLATPRHVPAPEKVVLWDDREVVMLAHLIGDGSFVRRQPIRYASIDEANLKAVTGAATCFGITPIRDDYPAARVTTLRLPAPFPLTHGVRNPIAAWLDKLGLFGARSHEKFVPEAVFALPKRQITLFLRHLWATDGCIYVRPEGARGPLGSVYYGTTSRRLADDVSRLLWRYGIPSSVTSSSKAGYRPGYQVRVHGASNQSAFLRVIGVHGERGNIGAELLHLLGDISGRSAADTVPRQVWDRVRSVIADRGTSEQQLATAIGVRASGWTTRPSSRERLARVAGVLNNAELELLATNDVVWETLTQIEPDGCEEVYDATVVGAHNFVANGIATHNSIEQDADMVILLHREDMYEKESPRAGEADFIVAKHRNGPTDTITVAFQGHYSRFVDMAT